MANFTCSHRLLGASLSEAHARGKLLALAALCCLVAGPVAHAQCAVRTGSSHTVLFPPDHGLPHDQVVRAIGDTDTGPGCVGEAVVPYNQGFALTIWLDDPYRTTAPDGVLPGSPLRLVIAPTGTPVSGLYETLWDTQSPVFVDTDAPVLVPDGLHVARRSSGLYGDVNADGFVSIVDLVVATDVVLGRRPETFGADLTPRGAPDGIINIVDLVSLTWVLINQ
jgi:hypothetical protein